MECPLIAKFRPQSQHDLYSLIDHLLDSATLKEILREYPQFASRLRLLCSDVLRSFVSRLLRDYVPSIFLRLAMGGVCVRLLGASLESPVCAGFLASCCLGGYPPGF
ncbi:hypothetical protein E2C01_052555 [Portunus trituberculatus]|uniref:Uncharacterized protein n=1 Tax=Portunus trituberculatus TaxID=210409 RepID=A0A5B7GLU2_PORTR|nr:hypothetical protein [Portunus trituberculatus]